LKLFANRDNLSFSDVESIKPDQELTLSPSALEAVPQQLNMAKFQKAKSVNIFIEDNQGGLDTTILNKLELNGIPRLIKGSKIDRPKVTHSRMGDALNPV